MQFSNLLWVAFMAVGATAVAMPASPCPEDCTAWCVAQGYPKTGTEYCGPHGCLCPYPGKN
ncbi:uncharacterized protein RSE6_06134 [Rhynchosporium secalis]|uniref:Uncharacterized protein n=1 Tax=Rhynchosporium secalis TaxID=38038 RepID=A0A1E1M9P4_RHYSE|nr:uncharacterized protein RSE6_06134 [Rhynchosporium secalis]